MTTSIYQAAGQINIDDKNEIHFVMNIPAEVGKPDQPIWELSELYHVKKIGVDSGYTVNITTMIDVITTHPDFKWMMNAIEAEFMKNVGVQ